MQYHVFDISLSLFEQTFDDDALAPYLEDYAIDISDEARAAVRTFSASESTVFVFRLPIMHDWQYYPKSLRTCLEALEAKAESNSLHAQIVLWSEEHSIKSKVVSDPNGEFEEEEVDIAKIRQSELLAFLNSEGVFLEHAGDALFDLPSNQFSDYFLRIGNLQSKQSFLSAVFFWSIGELRNVRHIFCDTWSISTSCALVSEFLNLYRGMGQPVTMHNVASWSFSPGYLPSSETAQRLLREAKDLAEKKQGDLLVLSSFYSSGSLERSICEAFQVDEGDYATKLVAIYAAGKDFSNSSLLMCDVNPLVRAKGLRGKNAERHRTSELLNVNPLTFFPDYRVPEVLRFKVSDIFQYKDFFDKYKGDGIFSVHRDGQNFGFASRDGVGLKSRHHAFHIDAVALFQNSSFKARLQEKLSGLDYSFDCIISDQSTASQKLYDAVAEVAPNLVRNSKQFAVSDWRLLESEQDFVEMANYEEATTLVLVPTVISSQSLGLLRRQMRRTVTSNHQKYLHFLIGLLRPDGNTEITNYIDVAEYFGSSWSTVIEQVIIPDWGTKECPWCKEEIALDKILADNRDAPYDEVFDKLSRRLENLQSGREVGLRREEVFFSSEDAAQLPFEPGSLYQEIGPTPKEMEELERILSGRQLAEEVIRWAHRANSCEADLCLVVASSMQNWRLRSKEKSLRRPAIDAASILHPDKFNEARLRAAIWRSLLPNEISVSLRAAGDEDFPDLLVRVFGEDYDEHHSCLRFELLLSFMRDVKLLNTPYTTPETNLFLSD